MTKSKIFHRRVFNCDAMGITIWEGVGGKEHSPPGNCEKK